jgi:hypothetical protein
MIRIFLVLALIISFVGCKDLFARKTFVEPKTDTVVIKDTIRIQERDNFDEPHAQRITESEEVFVEKRRCIVHHHHRAQPNVIIIEKREPMFFVEPEAGISVRITPPNIHINAEVHTRLK